MKYFSFKILFICIVLPPLLHLGTIQTVETYLQKRYHQDIENVYTGDTRLLLNGSINLKDAINTNIDNYLKNKQMVRMGAKTDVLVTTRRDSILYPTIFDEESDAIVKRTRNEVAADNYRLMNEGLVVKVSVSLERDSILVVAVFGFYYFISLLVLYRYYRIGAGRARLDALAREKEIDRLHDLEKQQQDRLQALREDKKYLSTEFQRIKKTFRQDKMQTTRNEDEFINEIMALEENVKNSLKLYGNQQRENEELRELVNQIGKDKQKGGRQKRKVESVVQKRFKALYKHVTFENRAYEGFAKLTEDMKIKAEEVVQQLSQDPAGVLVKRKVLMKKNPTAVFEVTFAYNGRIYFTRSKDNPAAILAIGTKNTQDKDLAYIDKLS
jgi:hypothetical protein